MPLVFGPILIPMHVGSGMLHLYYLHTTVPEFTIKLSLLSQSVPGSVSVLSLQPPLLRSINY